MKYRLVIFDMDGTILDTLSDLCDSLNFALQKNGYPSRTLTEVRSFVGNGIRKLIERGVPMDTLDTSQEKVFADFSDYYAVHCMDKTQAYDGIVELIHELRDAGCMTAVVSNKDDYAVQVLCKELFNGAFDLAVGTREGIRKKPYPDMVYEVMTTLGVGKSECVYIGDSEVDIETAKNSDTDCITVLWGFRDREFLEKHGAKVYVNKPSEIRELVND